MRKKSFKTILRLFTSSILICMMLILVMPSASLTANAAGAQAVAGSGVVTTPGVSENQRYFKEDTYYEMSNKINAPVTIEFELAGCTHIGSSAAGVIIGNYSEDATSYINVEAIDYGRLRVRGKYNGGSEWVANFEQSEADIRSGGVHHYAIVLEYYAEYGDSVHLYVDGVKKATRYPSIVLPKASDFTHPFRIGGDYRTGNTNYFKGLIYSVAMYSDMRSASEIASDKNITKTWGIGNNLVAAYDLTRMGEAALRDYSGSGNKLLYHNGSGIQVENFGKYEIDQSITSNIETFEAWVYVPKSIPNSISGTIVGNYRSYNGSRVWLEIYKDGNPRLAYSNASGSTSYHRFTDVNLKNSTWTHLTVVHDLASGEARCYVNGVLMQTLTENVLEYRSDAFDQKFLIGRDTALRYAEGDGEYWENRADQYFKGFIKEVRLYSDVRSAEEIASDYAGALDKNDAGLLACYQISPENAYGNLEDISGNGYTAAYKQLLWEKEYVELPDKNYSYSLAIVGDTQTVTDQNPELLKNIYQWILNNQSSKNIQYVVGLGDITEYGVDVGHTNYEEARAKAQWEAAKEAISLMDGKIPYSLIRGDGHDGIELFNQYFADHEGYTSNIAGYYQEGRIDNVYHTFKAGTVDYLLLCLDHGTKDDVLVWANEVVSAHPNHKVIVTTHHYMQGDGTLSTRDEIGNATAYNPNNNAADDLWNKFLSKHPNIAMIICGHSEADDVVVTKQVGNHGNEVTQILVNPQVMDAEYGQGSKGMVAMLYFSEDGTDVQVEYYSTLKDTYCPITTNAFTVSTGSHNYKTIVTAPTCTDEGYTTHTCIGCDDKYITDTVPATGHTEEKIEAVAPTCAETGLTEGKKCSVCGTVTVEQTVVPTIPHIEQTLEAVAPTCTETGLTEGKKCSVCGTVTVEQTVVRATGHIEQTLEEVAPTCTETGLTEGKKCSVCDTVTVEQIVIRAIGHIEQTLEAAAPTCTETGLTAGKKCTVCGTVTVEQTTVPALGHTEGTPVTENNVAPDCTTVGGYDTVVYCSVCSVELTRVHTEVSALGHTEETVPGKDATCTETGLTEGKKCTVCGTVTVEQTTVPALGHTEGTPVTENNVAPDCTTVGGYDTVVYCTVCNTELSRVHTEVSALGHTEETVPGKDATCTETGLTDGKKCTVCGTVTVKQSVIPALGHTDAEPKDYICDVCEADLCTVHVEEIIPGMAATCTETGLTEGKKCTVCGDVTVEQTIVPALGHTEGAPVKENNVDPTCTTKGGYDMVTYCTVCGTELGRTHTELDALGHNPGEAVKENVVAPTCTTKGGYDMATYCTVCKVETSRVHTELDALGHTAGTPVKENNVDPTCTDKGSCDMVTYCTVCEVELDRVHTELDALGHDWADATTEAPKTCKVCGETEGEKLPTDAPETEPGTDAPVIENHDECKAPSFFEEILMIIINFFRELAGLPKKCYCGAEL